MLDAIEPAQPPQLAVPARSGGTFRTAGRRARGGDKLKIDDHGRRIKHPAAAPGILAFLRSLPCPQSTTLRNGPGDTSRRHNEKYENMSLDRTDVAKIAHLARLAISDDEKDHYAADLSKILSLVEQMNAIDTAGVTPMAHPLDMVQHLRADEPTEPDRRELFQGIAPATEGGLYLVPKVIE
jgi:aspartyl-tRNA(Asn)/glutamyl-tRNA(Gln) amidotransferase subunit C